MSPFRLLDSVGQFVSLIINIRDEIIMAKMGLDASSSLLVRIIIVINWTSPRDETAVMRTSNNRDELTNWNWE